MPRLILVSAFGRAPLKQTLRRAMAGVVLLLGAGCATPGGDQRLEPAPGEDPPLRANGTERVRPPPPPAQVRLPEVGDYTAVGTVTLPEIAQAYRARLDGDYPAAIAASRAAIAALPASADAVTRWWHGMYLLRLLVEDARIPAAAELLPQVRVLERQAFAADLVAAVVEADLALFGNRAAEARQGYREVLRRLGRIESGLGGLSAVEARRERAYRTEAQARAVIGMALSHLFDQRCDLALAWSDRAYAEQQAMLYRQQQFPYHLLSEVGPDSVQGFAWSQAIHASTRICHSGELAPSLPLIRGALEHFDRVGFRDGPLAVAGLLELAAARAGLLQEPTRAIGELPEPGAPAPPRATSYITGLPADLAARLPNTGMRIAGEVRQRPAARPAADTPEAEYRLPGPGQLNSAGIPISEPMHKALQAYLAGDGDRALEYLDLAEQQAQTPLSAWHLSYTRAQVLILLGRSADAEIELARTAELELRALGTNLNARALRGDARAWLGDPAAARADYQQVLAALGDWRLPARYVFPPASIPQLVALTRAQLRAQVGLAMNAMLAGDYAEAAHWAARAEALLDEAFHLIHHPAYGRWLTIDADLFFGRGLNLGIWASARLALQDQGSSQLYRQAGQFFEAVGFRAGQVLVEGMRARALYDLGRLAEAGQVAGATAAAAAGQGLPEVVWQMQALRGEALLRLQQPGPAEAALRAAQSALAVASGALASDKAKRRYGIGKESVTRNLVRLSLERGDLAQVFDDLERGRALAFVDLLGARAAEGLGEGARLAGEIRVLDRRLRRLRLAAYAGGVASGREPLAQLLRQRETRVADLRGLDTELAATLAVTTAGFDEVQATLGPGEALAYFLPQTDAEGKARLLLVEAGQLRLIETGLTPARLQRDLQFLRAPANAAIARLQQRRVRGLYAALDLADRLPSKRLYVVASGALHHMPWGALPLPPELQVVVIPTAGWLLRVAPRPPVTRAAVVVGDPAFGGSFPQLPGARAEARLVAERYAVQPLIGEDATEAALRAAVGAGVGVLHLATHGVFDPAQPLQSAVMLSDGGTTHALTAQALFSDPLRARLVVLSACETGLGRAEAGDDHLGLARSFYLGGATTIVNTLWPVQDEATRSFMEAFHRQAASGDYGTAWTQARNLLREAGFPPGVYGAFILGGSAGP